MREPDPYLVTTYRDLYPERAAQLVALLEAQEIEAYAEHEYETADAILLGHSVLVFDEADRDRAVQIAAGFDADYAGALDYMAERGIKVPPPVRPGCGCFWFFPFFPVALSAILAVDKGIAGNELGLLSLVAVGVLMAVAFRRLSGAQAVAASLSDADAKGSASGPPPAPPDAP